MKLLISSVIFSSVLALPALANNTNDIKKPHTIFVGAGHGDVEFEYQLNDTTKKDNRTGEIEFFGYRYQMNETWSLDARYINGKPGFFSGLFHSSSEVNFDARVISAQAQHKLSQRWSLYGNLGLNHYDWDIVTSSENGNVERQTLQKENGVGLFAAAGAKVEWERVEISFDYQILKMDDLDADFFSLAVGFKF
ncbi:MAG: outer membrane beta-barrel protein [Psychrobium sp.]